MLRRIPIATLALLVASVVVNVGLARKVSALRLTIVALKSDGRLKTGERVPDLSVVRLDGGQEQVRFAEVSVPTLLYVFTPGCSWCYRNKENIRAVADSASGKYRVIGLSLSSVGLEPYIAQHHISFPVYAVSSETRARYKLGGTPQSLLVGRDGKIVKNWVGAFDGGLRVEIERELGVRLPGLVALPPRKAGL